MARLHQVGENEAQHQRDEGRGDEPAERLREDASHRGRIAHVRDPHHQRGEHQRADQHLDEAQEHVRPDRHVARDLGRGLLVGELVEDHVADDDAEHQADQDADRRRKLSFHGMPSPFSGIVVSRRLSGSTHASTASCLSLGSSGRTPKGTRIGTIGVELQHLVIELTRGFCRVVQPNEVTDVLACFFHISWTVIVAGNLMSRDNR
jgi:hypothetical protein